MPAKKPAQPADHNDNGAVPEAEVNVPAPKELKANLRDETTRKEVAPKSKPKAEKPEEKVNPKLQETLNELAAQAAKLRGMDEIRAHRDNLIREAFAMGAKPKDVRESSGLSNANVLRISKS